MAGKPFSPFNISVNTPEQKERLRKLAKETQSFAPGKVSIAQIVETALSLYLVKLKAEYALTFNR